MRIAALYDVHGNLPALEAVLAEADADLVVSGGDVDGPFGAECRQLLERAHARFVRGNGDPGTDWPLTLQLGRVLFCHGTPRSEDEIVTRITPEADVAVALEGIDADVVVCGHTHVQYDRLVGGIRVVNAGSVGRPYEGRPGAFWALVGDEVELRRTDYDVEAAAAAIRARGGDDADDLAETLLELPSAEEATASFESQRAS